MTALPIAEWQHSLAEMETALAATLAALDRYQSVWHAELTEAPPAGGTGAAREASAGGLEDRLRAWDARLAAAGELAASVARELDDREAAVGRWREVIQQGVGRSPGPAP